MKKQDLKYEKAWDRVTRRYVTPSDVGRSEIHDRNRYYSEEFKDGEDKGYVLTLHKQSKEYKSKKGKTIVRKAHFVKIAENTKEYREKTDKKIKAQESNVHKLCKEVIKEIKFIRVPKVEVNVLNRRMVITTEQIIPIKLIKTEQIDKDTRKIPDITVETEILGKKQELFIEIFYTHEVDESKRKQLNYFNKNCLEVDISDIRDNLDLSEKVIKKLIKERIENHSYWISSRVKNLFEKEVISHYVLDINSNNFLRKTEYHGDLFEKNKVEWYYKRFYFFKDNIEHIVSDNHRCYLKTDLDKVYTQNEKCTNIGDCKNCSNCVGVDGYLEQDIRDVHIYCDTKNLGINNMNHIEFINMLFNKLIELL